jgi:Cytochrome C oxidase copper chaperone (COX17).
MNSLPPSTSNSDLSTFVNHAGTMTDKPKKKGPCCVCKETKAARDQCILNNGEEKCFDFIQAHKACLRSEGFETN